MYRVSFPPYSTIQKKHLHRATRLTWRWKKMKIKQTPGRRLICLCRRSNWRRSEAVCPVSRRGPSIICGWFIPWNMPMFRWHHPQDICAFSSSSFISSESDAFFLLCLAKQLPSLLQFARLRNAAPNLFCWWSSNHAALWLIDRCMDTVIRFPGLDDHQQTCSWGMQADYNPSATPSIDRKAGVLRYCYRMAIYVIMLLSSDSVEAALFYCFGSSPALRPFLEKKRQRWSNFCASVLLLSCLLCAGSIQCLFWTCEARLCHQRGELLCIWWEQDFEGWISFFTQHFIY
jgi:hypothetical protein